MTTETQSLLVWLLVGAGVIAVLVGIWVLRRGRPLPGDHVFRASRWSRGNHLFPTQVAITPTSVVQYTPTWFGRREHSIHMAHVASVEIDTNLFFSNLLIETSGGSDPVQCHGHRKKDAMEMKRLITQYQSEYYKGPRTGPC
ncbi:MAG TPA: hypothetical protein VEL79_02360 [Vicinamibacterales bacterium]|jgi:hypothetical protein|nr:hypothetical protein [Vicinamibacterales bacterium]